MSQPARARRRVVVLGSTGRVGSQVVQQLARQPERFQVIGLSAGRNLERLAQQVALLQPRQVCVAQPKDLVRASHLLAGSDSELLCGAAGADALAAQPEADLVLNAMVGAVGLRPTLAALRPGVLVAIANKEPLVMAGELIAARARQSGATLLPLDSEHCGLHQLLAGREREQVQRLLLTGSGGPLRQVERLDGVTPEQVLAHPVWPLGPKISVDSATLMNKGLELIEARWLFDVPHTRMEVLIHPQCVVHALVELTDGVVLAQLATPDMALPIAYALNYPQRLPTTGQRLDLVRAGALTFAAPDMKRFPCLRLANQAAARGATLPAVLNAANEVAVQAFLERRVQFDGIAAIIEHCLERHTPESGSLTLERVLAADAWARRTAAARLAG